MLNGCYNALYAEVVQVEDDEEDQDDLSDVWEISQFKDTDFWFLRSGKTFSSLFFSI